MSIELPTASVFACVHVPALPLQKLLLRHLDWKEHAACVVAEDKPQARILWVNELARAQRILPGLRYAAGLSLAADLRAGVVDEDELQQTVEELVTTLRRFSPHVEPSFKPDPSPEDRSGVDLGIFWLDASGLGHLYPNLEEWARQITNALRAERFQANLAVAFTHFGSYALARTLVGENQVLVCKDRTAEQTRVFEVRLDRLNLCPALRDRLFKLGIVTLRDFASLPANGLLERFGKEAYNLHRSVTGLYRAPLVPQKEEAPLRVELGLDDSEDNVHRLLFLIKRRLGFLLAELASRGQALSAIQLQLTLADRSHHDECLKPAEPTLNERQILELVRLRLETLSLAAGVTTLHIELEGVRATREQLQLFVEKPRRDLRAANRALARIRADLGSDAVVRAVLEPRHLPEASFSWQPLESLKIPEPQLHSPRQLVRRIFTRPQALIKTRAEHTQLGKVAGRQVLGPAPPHRLSSATPGAIQLGHWHRAGTSGVHSDYGSAWGRLRAGGEAFGPGPSRRPRDADDGIVDESGEASHQNKESGLTSSERRAGDLLIATYGRDRRSAHSPRLARTSERAVAEALVEFTSASICKGERSRRGGHREGVNETLNKGKHFLSGPHIVSGGWWSRLVHREYYFVEVENGSLLWIYFDRQRERWFLQGSVD